MRILGMTPGGEWLAVFVDLDDGEQIVNRLVQWLTYEDEGDWYTVGVLPSEGDGLTVFATPPPEGTLFVDYAHEDDLENEQDRLTKEGIRLRNEHLAREDDEEHNDGPGEEGGRRLRAVEDEESLNQPHPDMLDGEEDYAIGIDSDDEIGGP